MKHKSKRAADLVIVELRIGGIVRYQFNVNGKNAGDFPTRERAQASIDRYLNRDQMRADFTARLAAK